MKPSSLLLLTLMVFFSYSDVVEAIWEDNYCKDHPNPACIFEKRAHCGSDGNTYGSQCDFCTAYFESGRKLRMKYYGRCITKA